MNSFSPVIAVNKFIQFLKICVVSFIQYINKYAFDFSELN